MQRVLVIGAHADDETLGCGGTLLKHKARGDSLWWIIVTAPWEPQYSSDFIQTWQSQVNDVSRAFSFEETITLGLPTTRLDVEPLGNIIARLHQAIRRINPDTVYVVHHGDVHSDHRVVFEAAYSAIKPMDRQNSVKELLTYETLSSTNLAPPFESRAFLPQMYVDIAEFLPRKLDIARAYRTEMHAPPHPRALESVEALARVRGAAAGMMFAEAFSVVRRMW